MYRGIVEASPDGIWVLDLDGRTLYANPAMALLLGRTGSETAPASVYDAFDADGRVQLRQHLADLREGRSNATDVECLFVRKDGSARWALVRESLLAADEEGPARVVLRVTDWADRRSLVETLSRQQAALAEAERVARMGSWRYYPGTDLVVCSAGMCAALGIDEAAAPSTREAFLALAHPEDSAQLAREWATAHLDGGSFETEVRMSTPSGWRWFAGRGRAGRDADGARVHTGTFQDIHDRREVQAALEDAVLQNALMQATAAAANQAETFDEVLRMSQALVLAHDDWDRGRVYLPDGAGGMAPHWLSEDDRVEDAALPELVAVELDLVRRVRASRDVEWADDQPPGRHSVAFPVLHADEVVAVLVVGEAIPFARHELIAGMARQAAVQLAHVVERERTSQELAAARDAAMEGSRQKSDFLATMSHEIRTPLNGIIGLNDLLLRTGLDAEQQRLATGVQVSSRALLAIVDDVLDFSKIEAGRLELEEIDFDVRAVFDQVSAVLGEAARARGLDLVVACHHEVPEALRGDPTRLAQVLTNLGSNAVKFTDTGRVVIEARARPCDRGDEVELSVEVVDTGVGIAPEDRVGIFQRFVQADTSTTRRYGGTGLGLAICREIVDAFGGELGVESTLGSGSRFWFTARMRAAVGADAGEADRRARDLLGGRRVLVVDDQEHNRLVLRGQVGWWGVRSEEAVGVADALARIEAARAEGDPFELVLLDLAMPERDGFDLAAVVRGRPHLARLPLVLLSSGLPPPRERLRSAGLAACVSKPVLTATLRGLLLRHLAGAAEAEVAEVGTGDRHRVLVVEDNPVNQMVAAGLLDALGHDSESVDDGLAAVHAVRRAHEAGTPGAGFDLVLMDLQMPRLDGFEATRAIRESEAALGRPHVPVIAMTASAVSGERERCLAAGMDDFLTKPVDPRRLGALVARWLGGAGGAEDPGPPEVDTERLDMLRDLGEDHAYLDRVVARFVAHSDDLLAQVTTAVQAGDAAALREAAHSLKGSVTNLGLVRAGERAAELEGCGRRGEIACAAALLPSLVETVRRGRALLLDYRADRPS